MSMIGSFRRLPARDLERLLAAEPDVVEEYFSDSQAPEGFGAFTEIDVDKAWHGLHYLLTGSAWNGEPPLDFIARGGTELAADAGYGPPRAFTAAQVRAIADALAAIDVAALRSRFDPKAMMAADIYPTIWDRPPEEDDTLGYLAAYYEELRSFVLEAAKRNEGLIVSID